jgi:hypothetical protein
MENILINVDSRYRDKKKYINPGFFTYELDEPLKNIKYIRLSSIELPTTFYTFSEKYYNTYFKIVTENDIFDIKIKDGNYDSETIISAIQNIFTEINNEYATEFNISWDPIDYKITIKSNIKFGFIFSNDDTLQTLGYLLGYRQSDENYNYELQKSMIVNGSEIYYWVGDTFLDTTKEEYLFVRINDYGIIYNQTKKKNLLAKVVLFDSQFVFDNGANFLTKNYEFKQPVNINKLEIELILPSGFTIDLNLIDYSLTLEFGQIYDSRQFEKNNFIV